MKYYVLMLAGVAWAQSTTTTYQPGLNGNAVADGSVVTTDGVTTRTTKSINDGQVPQEQTVERVLSKTASGQVTEKIIRRFDQTGTLMSTERIVTDTQNQPSGQIVHATTYRSDINGNMAEAERKTVESTTHGAVTNTQTTIDRATINGVATVEKRSAVSETSDHATHTDEMIYRLSPSGTFDPAFRTITDITQSDGKTVQKTAQYEPIQDVNKMELSKQIVKTTSTRADGTAVEQTDYYASSVPGNVAEPGAPQRVYEQDTIERKPGGNGTVVETFTARRADMSNPKTMGPPIKVSETVCTGKCQPDKN